MQETNIELTWDTDSRKAQTPADSPDFGRFAPQAFSMPEKNPATKFVAGFFAAALLVVVMLLGGVSTAHAGTMTKAQVTKEAKAAGRHYHLTAAQIAWCVKAVKDIVFTGEHPEIADSHERRESNGHTKTGHINGCYGLLQFNTRWNLGKNLHRWYERRYHKRCPKNWRGNGKLSVDRFIKVYHDGGKAAVRKHWEATLGK